MADHKAKHRHSAPTVENLRLKQRETQIEIRKKKRDRKYNSKRIRQGDDHEEDCITLEETQMICQELAQKGAQSDISSLQKLKQAFTQGVEYIDVLFRVDNCLHSMVGLLTGSSLELQELAAWSLTNVATGQPEHVLAVAKTAAPYFITYISGSSPLLQDQCAWALGNIAGDSVECRKILHDQGCLQPLIKLMQSDTPACARSAAFAIGNLIRDLPDIAEDAVKQGILPVVLELIKNTDTPPEVACEVAWVTTYLTSSGDIVTKMVELGFLPVVVDVIVHHAMTDLFIQDEGEIVTPMLRALGNICTGPDEYSLMACENPRLMPALLKLLECSPLPHVVKETASLPHVVKETVWVLSNMTSDYSVSQSISYGPMLKVLLNLLDQGHELQIETMYALCNMASHGESVCEELVAHGALAKVAPLLKLQDLELVHMALAFCERALRYAGSAAFLFEECGGVANLEQLLVHPNSDIHNQAQEIFDKYFDEGAEEDFDH